MNEETLKVLEMVKNGKITPEEGEKLLSAIGRSDDKQKKNPKYTMLRIRVDANDPNMEEQAKVNINVPLAIAKKAAGLLSLVPKKTKAELEEKGIDLDAINLKELIELFEDGELTEELVNVDAGDKEKGVTVRIYVD
ncbi:MAG: hypothetical protein PHO15_10150 [Eubacteriales bacterium]|nr:hypothetical protein [Eubacteriales bacterium]